eukprot:jgi/Botrbrau1/5087/Bobra.37_1s0049.1
MHPWLSQKGPSPRVNSATVKINRAGPRPEYAGSQNVERDNGDVPSNMPDETFLDSCGRLNEGVLQHGRGPRLYVGGIHADFTDDDVKMHFSRWRRVIDVYFPAFPVQPSSGTPPRCGTPAEPATTAGK